MNLESFTMSTPEAEYRPVDRTRPPHLGFPHEHMRQELIALIDPNKAYDYFLQTQGWDHAMVDAQVLTPLDQKSIIGTPPDQTSIMCYQLPGSITINGNPIVGGLDINSTIGVRCTNLSEESRSSAHSPGRSRRPIRMPNTTKRTTGLRVRTCQPAI